LIVLVSAGKTTLDVVSIIIFAAGLMIFLRARRR